MKSSTVLICRTCGEPSHVCRSDCEGRAEKQSWLEAAEAVLVDDLRVPIHIARGLYERATKEALDEHLADLTAELARRSDSHRVA